MAVTATTFKAAYPEFANADDEVVEAKLEDATALCPEAVWGDFADQGVRLETARALALSPMGRDMKLVNREGDTVYDADLKRLRLIVASGGRVV